jgi:perosamine synthetase|tara:strand:- start:339 stop:1496 length:1158 start_codon:yes stop_codon:yes gene_type:complete
MLNSKRKIYQVGGPYFSSQDINWILKKTRQVLKGKLSTGPFSLEFEKKFARFIGVEYAIFLNTCTSALEIAVKSLNLKKGDEVIVPCETFIATGMAVTSQGGKVVFANINPNTFCLDIEEIKKRVTKKTRAVMLVHFGGYMPFDVIEIKNYCKKKGIILIEDCAHAIGSKMGHYKAGSIGNVGCFSFFATKTISTGEGGMLTTNNEKLYKLALSLRERGRDWSKKGELYSIGWRSCRVPELCAVLGLSQFSKIKKIISHRNQICTIYNKELKKTKLFSTLPVIKRSKLSIWKHITLINHPKIVRSKIVKILKEKHNIIINWAYDPPLHLQPVYKKKYISNMISYKTTENLMKRHFHLPLHMQILTKDAKHIVKTLIDEAEKIVFN